MTTLEILTLARERVARGWTQASFARDWQGRECPPQSDEAVAWCLLGACEAVAPFGANDATIPLFAAMEGTSPAPPHPELTITKWNDAAERTQAEVLALYDRAIERARSVALTTPPADE